MILNILKRIYKKIRVVCSETPFGEDSCHLKTSQIDLQFGSSDFLLKNLYAVLNIVNNGKYLFIYFFYHLLYVQVDSRRNFDILSKRQNNKVSFTCQLGLGRIGLAVSVFMYLRMTRIFVTDTN